MQRHRSTATATEVTPFPLDLLVDLVNVWGDVPRRVARAEDRPYPPLSSLRGYDPRLFADAPADDELREVANLVDPVFYAADARGCAGLLTDLIGRAGLVPAVADRQGDLVQVWRTTRPDRGLLAAAVAALVEHLRDEPAAARLGACAGDECADVFVDESPAGQRRYCCVKCQNRGRAKAYRARRRSAVRAS